jgi:hypothetical protein
VLYTRTTTECRGDGYSSLVERHASDLRLVTATERRARPAAERALDQVLADSFPASDPPSWTLGVAQPSSSLTENAEPADVTATKTRGGGGISVKEDVSDVSLLRTKRSALQVLASLAGAAGIALSVPIVMLLIGLPVVLVIRGIAEVVGWLLTRTVG